MFSGLWMKVTAVLSAVVGALLFVLKIQRNTIKNQEEEIAGHEKKDEIRAEIKEGEKKLDDEAEEKLDDAKKNDSDWRNNI